MFAQWYGASAPDVGLRMTAKAVAQGIKAREKTLDISPVFRVADSAMWAVNGQESIADDFIKEGVSIQPCVKGTGSRVHGWEALRKRLIASLPTFDKDGRALPAEEPGLYVCDNCSDLIRTLPTLQRDDLLPDDIDTKSEDHDADALRYRVTHISTVRTQKEFHGA